MDKIKDNFIEKFDSLSDSSKEVAYRVVSALYTRQQHVMFKRDGGFQEILSVKKTEEVLEDLRSKLKEELNNNRDNPEFSFGLLKAMDILDDMVID